jgi:hypothetical protein
MYTCNGIYIPKEISKFTNTEPVPTEKQKLSSTEIINDQTILNPPSDLLSLVKLLIKISINKSSDQADKNNLLLLNSSKVVENLLEINKLLLQNNNISLVLYNEIHLIIRNFIMTKNNIMSDQDQANINLMNGFIINNSAIPSSIFLNYINVLDKNVIPEYRNIFNELFKNIIPKYIIK